MTILRLSQDSSFVVRCSRHKIHKMKPDQISAANAALITSVDWKKIPDPQLIVDASTAGSLQRPLTKWLLGKGWETNRDLLKLLGYPEWVVDRLTPEVDEYLPWTNFGGVWASFCPRNDLSLGRIHRGLREGGFHTTLKKCLGLQSLRFLQEHPEKIINNYRGYSIVAWKSAVIESSGTKKCHRFLLIEMEHQAKLFGTPLIWFRYPFDTSRSSTVNLTPTPDRPSADRGFFYVLNMLNCTYDKSYSRIRYNQSSQFISY